MLEALQAELGLAVGETTADGCFTLEKTACLGVCEVAPAMQINEVVIGHLTRDKIKQVLADYRAGKAPDYQTLPFSTNDFRSYKASPAELVVLDNVGVIDPTRIEDYLARWGLWRFAKSGDHHDAAAGGGGSEDLGDPGPRRGRFSGRAQVVLYPASAQHPEVCHL